MPPDPPNFQGFSHFLGGSPAVLTSVWGITEEMAVWNCDDGLQVLLVHSVTVCLDCVSVLTSVWDVTLETAVWNCDDGLQVLFVQSVTVCLDCLCVCADLSVGCDPGDGCVELWWWPQSLVSILCVSVVSSVWGVTQKKTLELMTAVSVCLCLCWCQRCA